VSLVNHERRDHQTTRRKPQAVTNTGRYVIDRRVAGLQAILWPACIDRSLFVGAELADVRGVFTCPGRDLVVIANTNGMSPTADGALQNFETALRSYMLTSSMHQHTRFRQQHFLWFPTERCICRIPVDFQNAGWCLALYCRSACSGFSFAAGSASPE
jgi:hypothetical protein